MEKSLNNKKEIVAAILMNVCTKKKPVINSLITGSFFIL